jgi:2,5-diamino-6-(ribosylamino)-4(3H)-pyrimidinone 5'-phosphate reductase
MRIMLNCAMSVDGKIALPTRRETKISNKEDLGRVHSIRGEADAILVGIGTILADDPKLTVNEKYAKATKQPLRIVLDSNGRTPARARVLDGSVKTLVVTTESCTKEFANAEVLRVGKWRVDLRKLLKNLDARGIKTLFVEGGEGVLWSFLKEGLADELSIFVGSMVIGGTASPTLAGGEGFSDFRRVRRLKLKECRKLGDGALLRYEVVK